MMHQLDVVPEARAAGSSPADLAASRPWAITFLLLSAWCGLVAGLLEVATIVLRKRLFDSNHLYGMSRHFIWLIPLTNLCVFLALGGLGCVLALPWRPRGRWLFCATPLCAHLAALGPGRLSPDLRSGLVGGGAGAGDSARSALRAKCPRFRRFVQVSFPLASGAVADAVGITLGSRPDQAVASDGGAHCRRRGRPTSS